MLFLRIFIYYLSAKKFTEQLTEKSKKINGFLSLKGHVVKTFAEETRAVIRRDNVLG